METQEREAATGRSRNVVHILPQSIDSVPRFLTGPLEHVDASAGGIQLVVVTEDAESAVALAEAVLRITGPGGIELFPVTSARRAGRLMQGRPILAIAGAPVDLAELIRGSRLKLQDVRTIVLAWVDDLLESEPEGTAALELLMTEVPKDAARVVVTATAEARVNAFVERYLRRARTLDERNLPESAEAISLQYVTVSQASRVGGLRRLLDDLDPPSAAIVVGSAEAENAASNLLRTLGYPPEGDIRVTRGEVAPNTHAVIFFGLPATHELLAAAMAAAPVVAVAMIQPRELAQLRRTAGGEIKPLTLTDAGRTARDRERVLRRELSGVLESGVPAREVLALEPLLDRHDGIEIAAAALRLLERERAMRRSIEAAAAAAAKQSVARFSTSGDRASSAGDQRRFSRDDSRPPRTGGRPPTDRGEQGAPARGGRSASEKGGRPAARDTRSERTRGGREDATRGKRPPRDRS